MKAKKLLSALLVFAMLFSLMGVTAMAEETSTAAEIFYNAVKNAEADSVVELTEDVTYDTWKSIYNKDGLTINGNGKTITVNAVDSNINGGGMFLKASNLTINDLTVVLPSEATAERERLAIMNGGTLNNVTVIGGTHGVSISGDVTINNCTFEGQADWTVETESNPTSLTITNCTFEDNAVIFRTGSTNTFSGNTIANAGEGVNVLGNAVITGNDFGESTLGIYSAPDVKVEIKENIIEDVTFTEYKNGNDYSYVTVESNTLSEKALETLQTTVNENIESVAYVAKIDNKPYYSLNAALTAAVDGDEIVVFAGTYVNPGIAKNITFKAAEGEEVTFDISKGINLNGADITFENIIFDYYPNVNYTGLQHSGNLVYNICTFNGQPFLYGVSETFNNCTFNQDSANAYNVWTYGSKEVTFNQCTFNSAGKSVLVYNEGATGTALTVTDSDFIASAPVEGKAAIEIGSSLLKDNDTHSINIDNLSTATGFDEGSVSGNSLWNNKEGEKTTVVVNNEVVLEAGNATASAVAEVNGTKYNTLQEAVNAASNATVKLLGNEITTAPVEISNNVVIDLNGYTLTGSVDVKETATVEIKNGSIDNTDKTVSAVQTVGNTTLTDLNVVSARHSVRVEGGKTVINSGSYTLHGTKGLTTHVVNVSDGGEAVINDGTFIGCKGKDSDSGYTIQVQPSSTVTINGGNFSNGSPETLKEFETATLTVNGGTFDENPSSYLAEGVSVAKNADGTFGAGTLPNAEVKSLGAITVDEYSIYNGSLTDGGDPIDLQIAMEFIAKDTPEEAAANAFGQYTTDFFIKIDGLAEESFVANGCYLAGNYGAFGWIMIPLDGMEIVGGKVYPVISSVSFNFTYEAICSDVKDFKCGIYFSDDVIKNNPDMKVTLTLGLSENLEAAQNAEFITVDEPYTYTVSDFLCSWTTDSDSGFYYTGETKYGMMRFLFKADIDGTVQKAYIKYINGNNITDNVAGTNGSVASKETSSNAFYGDIVNISETENGTYYAAACIETDEGIFWSDIVDCTINWNKHFTQYQPTTTAGGAENE